MYIIKDCDYARTRQITWMRSRELVWMRTTEAAPISETRRSATVIARWSSFIREREKMAVKRRPSMSWKTDTIKREEAINKELTMQINNRRRMSTQWEWERERALALVLMWSHGCMHACSVYGDLNYLLVSKDHLSKLTASKVRLSVFLHGISNRGACAICMHEWKEIMHVAA